MNYFLSSWHFFPLGLNTFGHQVNWKRILTQLSKQKNQLKTIDGMMTSVAFRGACPHNTRVNELLRKKISIL